MKRMIVGLAVTALLAAAAASASSASPAVAGAERIAFQNTYFGCHAWPGTAHAVQRVTVRAGGMLVVRNRDTVRHTLLQVSGPAAAEIGSGGRLLPGGAPVAVRLFLPGSYLFKTIEAAHSRLFVDPGGDGALDATALPDRELQIVVRVLPTIE